MSARLKQQPSAYPLWVPDSKIPDIHWPPPFTPLRIPPSLTLIPACLPSPVQGAGQRGADVIILLTSTCAESTQPCSFFFFLTGSTQNGSLCYLYMSWSTWERPADIPAYFKVGPTLDFLTVEPLKFALLQLLCSLAGSFRELRDVYVCPVAIWIRGQMATAWKLHLKCCYRAPLLLMLFWCPWLFKVTIALENKDWKALCDCYFFEKFRDKWNGVAVGGGGA